VDTIENARSGAREGVRTAILSSRMESIARKMQNTLFRTARSGVLNTAHDFSCVVLTADCRLLATAESLPIHTLIGPDLMCQAVRRHHPVLRAGDCFLHNSPYEGNSHPADHCLIAPVVDEDGILRFFVLAKAHQADCGNSRPTTYMGHAVDVYEEGALIFSAAKVQSDYQDSQDLIRMCKARIRVPEQWWGDYLATLGAVRIGARELLALGCEIGWDALERYAEFWFDYSEKKMIDAIRRLPSGRTVVYSGHDPFPGVPDGIPVKVEVEVDAEGGRIAVDLTDNIDCQPSGLTSRKAAPAPPQWSASTMPSSTIPCRRTLAAFAAWRFACGRTAWSASRATRIPARWRRPISPTAWRTPCSAPSPRLPQATAWRRPGRLCPPRWESSQAATRVTATRPS
jgi:N-methylhydantoinase B